MQLEGAQKGQLGPGLVLGDSQDPGLRNRHQNRPHNLKQNRVAWRVTLRIEGVRGQQRPKEWEVALDTFLDPWKQHDVQAQSRELARLGHRPPGSAYSSPGVIGDRGSSSRTGRVGSYSGYNSQAELAPTGPGWHPSGAVASATLLTACGWDSGQSSRELPDFLAQMARPRPASGGSAVSPRPQEPGGACPWTGPGLLATGSPPSLSRDHPRGADVGQAEDELETGPGAAWQSAASRGFGPPSQCCRTAHTVSSHTHPTGAPWVCPGPQTHPEVAWAWRPTS